MTAAVLKLLGNLEQRLVALKAPPQSVDGYIFGGAAVHILIRRRVFDDLDIDLVSCALTQQDIALVKREVAPIDYVDSDGKHVGLELDTTYNTTLGLLHEDSKTGQRCSRRPKKESLRVYLPAPEDVAITKLGRLSVVDLEDIQALMKCPEASVERFDGYWLTPRQLRS